MTRRLLVLPVAAAAALGAAALPAGAADPILLEDDVFAPTSRTVKKGSTVTFRWAGRSPHNVTVVKGPVRFSSTTKRTGTYKRRLTRAGTYRLTCTLHAGMDMTLRVK